METHNGKGEARGDDLVIDASDGHIAFVGLTDVAGKPSDALVAIPFSCLSKKGDNTFARDITSERLAAASSFNDYSQMNNNRAMAEDTYRSFGIEPHWTE